MRFRVEREAFAEAVAWTARALPNRPTIPVIAGMRLDAAGGDAAEVRLSGFDYEVSARAAVEIDAEEPGSVLVSGRLLAEIIRNLPPHPVDVAADGPRVVVSCGATRFTLPTLPLEDYPDLPEMPKVAGSTRADVFGNAVRQVTFAASRDDTLPMLTGVHFSFAKDSVTLAATDRYRIAVRDMWWRSESPEAEAEALVPARTLAETARALLSDTNVDIALAGAPGSGAAGEGMIGFENGGRRTTTRLIDSDFIKYAHRFPTEFEARAEISVAPMVEAVKRVSLVAERGAPLHLAFRPGEAVLEAASGEEAQAREGVPVEYEGSEMNVAFAPQYFLDGLTAVESSTAYLGLTAPTKPAVISGAAAEGETPDFRYLVMPLRGVA